MAGFFWEEEEEEVDLWVDDRESRPLMEPLMELNMLGAGGCTSEELVRGVKR